MPGERAMVKLTIDNRPVEVPEGTTILEAARKVGIEIPTLCFREGLEPSTSCMVCAVKLAGRGGVVPSCALRVQEGMAVESETDEVRSARRMALELLLSDHLGDCMGPCHVACPARMDIPRMIRQIAAGRMRQALATVKADIALPAVLGRICPAPCEKACRRGQHDAPVAICLLKRHVADVDLAADEPYRPACAPPSGKKVAIVGAGPTGLAAAYYLHRCGHACTIFDDHPAPGGMLRYGVSEQALPRAVLDAEVATITALGALLRLAVRVGEDVSMDELRRSFDAVFVAAGKQDQQQVEALGLPWTAKGPRRDSHTYATPVDGVFAAGGGRQSKMAVRAVADGKGAAESIHQYVTGRKVTGSPRPFTVHIGKCQDGEMEQFLAEAAADGRVAPAGGDAAGFTADEARAGSRRCLHCDCRGADDCKLRIHAAAYEAIASKYRDERRSFVQHRQHGQVVFEPGKCIDCGLCVQVTARAGERLGLAFIGRGFAVRVAVPFDHTLAEGLQKVAAECVAVCPTGALAFRDAPPKEG